MSSSEREEHNLDSPALFFNLEDEIEELKTQKAWREGERNGITLIKSQQVRVTLIALKKGSKLPEHHAPGRMTLAVISGKIKFEVSKEEKELGQHEIVALQERLPHAVEALEDSAVLLTIVPDAEHKAHLDSQKNPD